MRLGIISHISFLVLVGCSINNPLKSIEGGIIRLHDAGLDIDYYEFKDCRFYVETNVLSSDIEPLIYSGLLNSDILQLRQCPPLQDGTTHCANLLIRSYEGRAVRILQLNSALADDEMNYNYRMMLIAGTIYHCQFSLPTIRVNESSDLSPNYEVDQLNNFNMIMEH